MIPRAVEIRLDVRCVTWPYMWDGAEPPRCSTCSGCQANGWLMGQDVEES